MTGFQLDGTWMVPTSSVDSSGLVPMKSKLRQRTVRVRACSPRMTSCWGVAAVWLYVCLFVILFTERFVLN